MAAPQQASQSETKRGLLARPLDALVFLLPLILFYELTSFTHRQDRVIAFELLRQFFKLFGQVGIWAPGLGVVFILVATHLVSREKWSIHWGRVGLMYAEAAALAVGLLALSKVIRLAGSGEDYLVPTTLSLIDRMGIGIGAGIYEELVFRLVLISVLMIIGADLLRLDRVRVAVAAIILSSLVFAAHHHQPMGAEPFDLAPFVFRTLAGLYLAMIFWYRGYGPAAGCHAAYNVALVCLQTS